MALLVWNETPHALTALMGDVPVCTVKVKDIGGCTAHWLNGLLWAPPAHMPRAQAQPSCFFASKEEARAAVERQMGAGTG